jgi:prophage regulatory protein
MEINSHKQPHFLRLRQIIGDSKANPPLQPIIPVSKSTWWAGIKTGKYPASRKIGARITVWLASDIYALLEQAPLNLK